MRYSDLVPVSEKPTAVEISDPRYPGVSDTIHLVPISVVNTLKVEPLVQSQEEAFKEFHFYVGEKGIPLEEIPEGLIRTCTNLHLMQVVEKEQDRLPISEFMAMSYTMEAGYLRLTQVANFLNSENQKKIQGENSSTTSPKKRAGTRQLKDSS